MKQEFLKGWSCTDPDNLQFCRKDGDDTFTYKELDKFDEDKGDFVDVPAIYELTADMWENMSWTEVSYNYNDLTPKEIAYALEAYGYDDLDQVKSIYGDDWKQIVVECHFEMEDAGY